MHFVAFSIKLRTVLPYCEELATTITLDAWIDIAENVHLEPDFYRNLQPELSEKEKNKLNLAISISSHTVSKIKSFWHSIYDFNALKEELKNLFVTEGDSLLNQVHNGIFEMINVEDAGLFFIFNIDPALWKTIS